METWKDIVAEMRGMREFYGAEYRAMADRIEAACKTLEDVLIVEQEENAKLRRALDPVMKVNADAILNSKIEATTLLSSIVKESQAIMKEGAK